MDANTRMIEIIKLINPYSKDEELEVFTQNRGNNYHAIPFDIITINDFTLHCIAAMAKQYGLVVVRDTQNNIWVGEYEKVKEEIERGHTGEYIWKTF